MAIYLRHRQSFQLRSHPDPLRDQCLPTTSGSLLATATSSASRYAHPARNPSYSLSHSTSSNTNASHSPSPACCSHLLYSPLPQHPRSLYIHPHVHSSLSVDPQLTSPRHAAASYGHLHVLEYLISHGQSLPPPSHPLPTDTGGDVNVVDNDGDTPLYTVENVETARFLVEHGAILDRQNNDGLSVCFTSPHHTSPHPQSAHRTPHRGLSRRGKLSAVSHRTDIRHIITSNTTFPTLPKPCFRATHIRTHGVRPRSNAACRGGRS